MTKKRSNNRCPLQAECEKVCQWQGRELDCDYYHSFARPGYELDDQELIRFKRIDEAMMAAYEADEDDDEEYVESPTAAENAAVMPSEAADEVSIFPASLHLDGSNGVTEKIKRSMYDAAKQFVYIGFLLWEVKEYGYYREKGYASVYDYAEVELGFKKSSTKNFIAVAETFGNKYFGSPWTRSILPTMTLQPEYKDFNYSQLCEMLSMSDKQRSKVTPDMTVRQIRDLKRREGEPDLPPNMETIPIEMPDDPASDPGQTSDQTYECRFSINGRPFAFIDSIVINALCTQVGIPYDRDAGYHIRIVQHKDV